MSDETTTEHLDAPPPISAELRAKILSDPNVAKMAETLQVPLEEFVNQVGYYLNNPGVEPAFLVVSDENLKKMGVEPPTEAALEANVRQTVAALNAHLCGPKLGLAFSHGFHASAVGLAQNHRSRCA
jgi:hypothetical protein